ncbi:hypothetical protein CMI37_15305 [Candidatus Pacearchaeota archaeon]|jgi:hypothetical protein|nr:hypothetical protein [Candidatus Pacearchaeota archaeon]|tara:strand:+ start:318 stop:977 length:660 start_codon:yes stop_codon:yes gene_type:complete
MNKIIGISGVAGSGKDTFCDFLSARLPCERYSLATELKNEVNQWCRMHYHIDSVNCSRDEKEIIRPFLVAHGTTKRKLSDGRHWIEKLHNKVIKGNRSKFKIITDIRYDDYENDEVSWLKNELGGILVHVSQYTIENAVHIEKPVNYIGPTRRFREPANSEEARNDPNLKEKSDFQIEWEFIKNGQIEQLEPYINDFMAWLIGDHEKDNTSRQHFNKES